MKGHGVKEWRGVACLEVKESEGSRVAMRQAGGNAIAVRGS